MSSANATDSPLILLSVWLIEASHLDFRDHFFKLFGISGVSDHKKQCLTPFPKEFESVENSQKITQYS